MSIVLTSCGIIKPEFKEQVLALFKKPVNSLKLLFITTAADGESGDKWWVDAEINNILSLGIKKDNIQEYKIGNPITLTDFDIIYMLGGNTFYLMKKIRETGFEKQLRDAIDAGVVYIGSSAGSIILGKTLKPAEIFGDEPVEGQGLDALGMLDGAVIPHMNQKSELYDEWLKTWGGEVYKLYDGDGIII